MAPCVAFSPSLTLLTTYPCIPIKPAAPGNSLVVQWLGLRAFTAMGPGSIPGQGTKILQAAWRGQKLKKTKTKKTPAPKTLSQALLPAGANPN